MKEKKEVKSKKDYTTKNLENAFISKLLEYLRHDLSDLYSRREDLLSGKSINYCKIGALRFGHAKNIKELESPSGAFRLGVEFGVNISIDVYNSLVKRLYENTDASKLIRKEIDIQQLLIQSSIQKDKILPSKVLRKLRKYKKAIISK